MTDAEIDAQCLRLEMQAAEARAAYRRIEAELKAWRLVQSKRCNAGAMAMSGVGVKRARTEEPKEEPTTEEEAAAGEKPKPQSSPEEEPDEAGKGGDSGSDSDSGGDVIDNGARGSGDAVPDHEDLDSGSACSDSSDEVVPAADDAPPPPAAPPAAAPMADIAMPPPPALSRRCSDGGRRAPASSGAARFPPDGAEARVPARVLHQRRSSAGVQTQPEDPSRAGPPGLPSRPDLPGFAFF